MTFMTKIAVNGALGRMGSRVLSMAYQSDEHEIVAAFEHAKHPALGKDLGSALGLGEGGAQAVGGFAEQAVADARYCFRVPEAYPDAQAAPLLCAGLIGFRALRLAGDAAFSRVKLDRVLDPKRYIGRAPQQVDEFIAEVVGPIRARYAASLAADAEIRV